MDYRQYEDPWKLQEQLKVAKQRRDEALDDGDEGLYESYCEDVADLEWRINLAWQDDEFDSEQRAAYEVEQFYENFDYEEWEKAVKEAEAT